MNPNNNSIITEDGQRLTVNDGLITGTEDPKPGLAYETGNIQDEDNQEGRGACPTSVHKVRDDAGAQEATFENNNG
ncbi:MAG: hypothetical protein ICV53_14870 [Flavisolibacter sp.]|nr:hypothetical protein [Flavisolibacter sp.]MBD0367369.1 hypothetical protein [Flavisolibacter sp.]